MKKILMIFFLSMVLFVPTRVFAIEVMSQDESLPEGSVSADSQPVIAEEDYTLPYPGLLPDNPLYFLKVARDNLIGFLITDPLKKAEFDLLQADKRLQAGVMLIERKKYDLALSTISKGENYFEDAITKVPAADKQGEQTSDFKQILSRAVKKHKTVLTHLIVSADRSHTANLTPLLKRIEKYEKDVMRLSLQK